MKRTLRKLRIAWSTGLGVTHRVFNRAERMELSVVGPVTPRILDQPIAKLGLNMAMRRFRFSLLSLLVVLTTASIAIVWGHQWIELQRLRAEHRALLEVNIQREQSEVDEFKRSLAWRKKIGGSSADSVIQGEWEESEGKLDKLKKSLSDLDR